MKSHRLRQRRRKNVKPGLAPGTIRVDNQAPRPIIDWIQYNALSLEHREGIGVDQIPKLDPALITWVNVTGLGDPDIIRAVAEKFAVHHLALEDVVNTHQRPKVEIYDHQLYVVLRMPNHNGKLDLEQVSLFVGANYVLTWQERAGDCFDPIRKRLRSSKRLLRAHGADFLAYALIDAIVDSFFPVLNEYNDAVDEIEEQFDTGELPIEIIHRLHHLRSAVRVLRQTARAHQTVLRNLMSDESDLLGDDTLLHFRDVADHSTMLIDSLENIRDTCSDLQELYTSSVGMKMNDVMKVLTIIATIFIPLGFIAGVYGMNFSTEVSPLNMPETNWYFGYPAALGVMAAVAGAMLVFFRRRRWI